jgi:hypothetical protein
MDSIHTYGLLLYIVMKYIAIFLSLFILSCQQPDGSLALIDPLMNQIKPSLVKTYAAVCSEQVVLPEDNVSVAF